MITSAIEVEQHIYNIIRDYVEGNISGKLYHMNCRPLNSSLEDAVIGISTLDAEQVQTGRARINIYCADIDNGKGRKMPNLERLGKLSLLANNIVELLNDANTDYDWHLFQAPQIEAEMSVKQHFVSIGLEFRLITF